MANAVYPKFKAAAMDGGPNANLLSGSIMVAMINTGSYTYSALHEFLSDVPALAIVATSGAVSGNAVTAGGAFQSGNARLTGVSGSTVSALVLFVNTGVPSTSRLVGYFDTGITGLPVTPAGASYNVIPDTSGWFVM